MDKLVISGLGFPGSNEYLEFSEASSHDQINAIVKALGNNVIFDGVIDDNGNSSSGWIIYNNEILPFEASATGDTVVIIETITTAAYDTSQTGNFNDVLPAWKKRKAKFGATIEVGVVDSFDFEELTRLNNLQIINGLLIQATEERLGLVEIPTQEEANSNDNDTHALTPKKLNNRTATTDRRGVVELTTGSEVLTGTDEDRAVTIKALRDAGYRISKITSGSVITTNRDGGQNQNEYDVNYKDIFPPDGYTMENLAGFKAGIAEIYFNGNVDQSDTLWCNYEVRIDRIRVICNNSESRGNSKVNYLAIWHK